MVIMKLHPLFIYTCICICRFKNDLFPCDWNRQVNQYRQSKYAIERVLTMQWMRVVATRKLQRNGLYGLQCLGNQNNRFITCNIVCLQKFFIYIFCINRTSIMYECAFNCLSMFLFSVYLQCSLFVRVCTRSIIYQLLNYSFLSILYCLSHMSCQ